MRIQFEIEKLPWEALQVFLEEDLQNKMLVIQKKLFIAMVLTQLLS